MGDGDYVGGAVGGEVCEFWGGGVVADGVWDGGGGEEVEGCAVPEGRAGLERGSGGFIYGC